MKMNSIKTKVFAEYDSGKVPSDLRGKYPIKDDTQYRYYQEWKKKRGVKANSRGTVVAQGVSQAKQEMRLIFQQIDRGEPPEKIVIKTGSSPEKVMEGVKKYQELRLLRNDFDEFKFSLEFIKEAKVQGYSARQICEQYRNINEMIERHKWLVQAMTGVSNETVRLQNEKARLINEHKQLQEQIEGMERAATSRGMVELELRNYLIEFVGEFVDLLEYLKKVDPDSAGKLEAKMKNVMPLTQYYIGKAVLEKSKRLRQSPKYALTPVL